MSAFELLGVGARPDFLIIGAQKAGTSALFSYLAKHPCLSPAKRKEIGYFSPEAFVNWPTHPSAELMRSLRSGELRLADKAALRWYHHHFPRKLPWGRDQLCYEASPEYLYFSKCPERIWRYDRNIKLIVLLRDPVERAYSAWNMFRQLTGGIYGPLRELRSFEEAIEEELSSISRDEKIGTDYVRRGLYHQQLKRYFERFDRRQLLILSSAALQKNTRPVVSSVCQFLQIPNPPVMRYPQFFKGKYRSRIPEKSKRRLSDFYAPHNELLFELIDEQWNWTR